MLGIVLILKYIFDTHDVSGAGCTSEDRSEVTPAGLRRE
jgi:hypothetical protein